MRKLIFLPLLLISTLAYAQGEITPPRNGGGGSGGVTPNSCGSNTFANGISNSSGSLNCSSVPTAAISSIPTLTFLGNSTGSTAVPTNLTFTAMLDASFGSTQGGILYRGSTAWTFLGPGSSGQCLISGGASANPSFGSCATGTVSVTGSPTNGELTAFSGAATITNTNLTGDATTTNTTATTVVQTHFPLVNKTATYTFAAGDYEVTCDVSGGTFTVTLPTAVGITNKAYLLKKIDTTTNACTLGTTSSQTIDGTVIGTSLALVTPGSGVEVTSDGANWKVTRTISGPWNDPAIDAIPYWQNSSKTFKNVGIGSNCSLTSGTLNCSTLTSGTIALPTPYTFITGLCNNTTATIGFSTPASNNAAINCVTGTNTNYAVADFAASSNLSFQGHFTLPSDMTASSAIDFSDTWFSSTTSGVVVWNVQITCSAAGVTGDQAFPTITSSNSVASTVAGTTNQYVHASIAAVTLSNCSAGTELFFKISRNAGSGSDTMSGTARLVSFSFIVRRTITIGG